MNNERGRNVLSQGNDGTILTNHRSRQNLGLTTFRDGNVHRSFARGSRNRGLPFANNGSRSPLHVSPPHQRDVGSRLNRRNRVESRPNLMNDLLLDVRCPASAVDDHRTTSARDGVL